MKDQLHKIILIVVFIWSGFLVGTTFKTKENEANKELTLQYNHYNLIKATPMDIACANLKPDNSALVVACDKYYSQMIWRSN